jgi:hypothetical protein
MLFDSLVKLSTQSHLAQEYEACVNAICEKEGGQLYCSWSCHV